MSATTTATIMLKENMKPYRLKCERYINVWGGGKVRKEGNGNHIVSQTLMLYGNNKQNVMAMMPGMWKVDICHQAYWCYLA